MSDMNEAPYSANFRMYFGAEPFQFTVRREDEASFITALTALVMKLESEGWEFIGSLSAKGALPPADKTTVAAAAATYTATLPTSPTGATPEWKMEQIAGYVVGSYVDRSGDSKPCVWLYAGNQRYKSYTVYPERADLLPFEYPTTIEWGGSAPEKDAAVKRNLFHAVPFPLPVLPETDAAGNLVVNKNGYQKYRLPKRDEMRERTVGTPTVHAEVTFAGKAKGVMHGENAIRWSMADDQQIVDQLQLESPFDQWLVSVRNDLFSAIESTPDSKRATQAHIDLINQWVANSVSGVDANTLVTVNEIGEVPLAAVVLGVLIDRYTVDLDQIPYDVTSTFLQLAMKKRGIGNNPSYSETFDENMKYVVGQALEILSDSTAPAF